MGHTCRQSPLVILSSQRYLAPTSPRKARASTHIPGDVHLLPLPLAPFPNIASLLRQESTTAAQTYRASISGRVAIK